MNRYTKEALSYVIIAAIAIIAWIPAKNYAISKATQELAYEKLGPLGAAASSIAEPAARIEFEKLPLGQQVQIVGCLLIASLKDCAGGRIP